MGVPDYQSIMLSLLKFAGDGKEHFLRDAIEKLADDPFNLTAEERRELLPSGKQPVFNNRVGWARTYLKKAGLLEYGKKGCFNITKEGLKVLEENPPKVDAKFLMRYPEFAEFHKGSGKSESSDKTPEEVLEDVYNNLRQSLSQDLLKIVKSCSPSFFESLVVDLLLAMGYGGSRKDAGEALGKSGDGGIDGKIKEDKLGLDVIYIQAKRWENTVGRPEIQKFVGALQENQAKKGVFITTAKFSKEAKESVAKNIGSNVILIDGKELASLMIDHNVGVSKVNTYEIKKIDQDYFIDE